MAPLSGVIRHCCWLLLLICGMAQADIMITENTAYPATDCCTETNTASPADENERILLFDAQASFDPMGAMLVNENIQVLATGEQIQRGIFRVLPLVWQRQDGKVFRVDYQIQQVWRDGEHEPYQVNRDGDQLTIRIGSAEHLLEPGRYHYLIEYRVSNHFSRFTDWDELYWNVTGNGWPYAIDKVRFRLQLPDATAFLYSNGKDTRLQSIDVYTGFAGMQGDNAQILADGSVESEQPLYPGEGLTAVYTWPRTILAAAPAPQPLSPLRYKLLPTQETWMLWIPVCLIVFLYLAWWYKNVFLARLKMPTVIPLYSIPEGFTPGYARYVSQCKYDMQGFTSDLLDLVARGYIKLTQRDSQPKGKKNANQSAELKQWLSRQTKNRANELNPDEKKLLSTLFSTKAGSIDLSRSYQKPMQKAYQQLNKQYEEQRTSLFLNIFALRLYIILLMASIPVICGKWFDLLSAIMTFPVLILFVLGCALLLFSWKRFVDPNRVLNKEEWVTILFPLLIGSLLVWVGGFIFMSAPLAQMPAGYCGALISAALLCTLFTRFGPRHTQQGLNALAIAKGLKMYLGTAEKHRYQALYPPEQQITHFERMLPYALALGVGKTWANAFAEYLASTGAVSSVFASANWHHVHHFSESCRSSSVATPSHSSGGSGSSGSGSSGGGSSGGGSGGGGGGGW